MNDDLSNGRAAFDEAFLRLGRRAVGAQWDTLLESPRSIIAQNKEQNQVLSKCHIDFIRDASVNGAATFRNGWALIACNTGTAEVFTALFSFLLSQPECLAGIGDESGERRWIESLAKCDWSRGREVIEKQVSICRVVPSCLPIDPTRRWWVGFLSNLALHFVYFHEIGHLVRGHLPLDGTMALLYSERKVDQFFELEADAWATRVLFQGVIGLVGTENVPTYKVAVAAITITAFFVYLVMDFNRSRLSDYHTTYHPHPAVRMSAFMVVLDSMSEDTETRKMIADSFATSYMVALQSAEALCMQGASLCFLKDGDEIGEEYLRIVDAGYANSDSELPV
jgi:hypothetical protein